jgi:hypothetical protein
MKTAFVLMTILGCDDSAVDCHHVATLQQQWTSIELCDAASEKELGNYANAPYPVVVAVCQTPDAQTASAPATEPKAADPATTAEAHVEADGQAPMTAEHEQSLTAQAITRVRRILPSTEGVKNLFVKPVRIVEDSYSWMAKRFTK